jgi:hypothetical protein
MKPIALLVLLSLLSLQGRQPATSPAELQVEGPAVVFFAPTQTERDSIMQMEGLEAGKVFDDFDYYAGRASSFLRKRSLRVEFTTTHTIHIRLKSGTVRKFERRSIPEHVGVILTDGLQEPGLIAGAQSDEDLLPEFRDFFHLNVCARRIRWFGRSFIAEASSLRSTMPRTTVPSPSDAQ